MKRLLFSISFGCAMLSATAAPITPAEALARLDNGPLKVVGKTKDTLRLVHTTKTGTGAPAIYVFNKSERGYLLLSADDLAYPVLGYADGADFDATQMPPQMKWWLDEYAAQIEYASRHPEKSTVTMPHTDTGAGRQSIAPQIKTKWDQGEPYNRQAPKITSERGFTGCVATAMAQVMNYWQYPEVGKGRISYDSPSLAKRLELNFANRKFDWANMSDTYRPGQYTDTEADAVAYLMKAAGYSVKMDYAADASGALAMNIGNALVKYFNYDPNLLYDLRMYHSPSEWNSLVYENLKNTGPLIYGGGSMLGGGHSFICDGYDAETGFFHFNWGWSGMSDGYFSLDALAPGSLGAGGGAGGGYNFTQDAVFGVRPPTGNAVEERPLRITQMGSLEGYIKGDSLKFDLTSETDAMWVNYHPQNLDMSFGVIIEPQGNTPGTTRKIQVDKRKFSVLPGYGLNPAILNPHVLLPQAGLEDGTYKVTMAGIMDDGENWLPVKECHTYYNYCILRKSGDKYTVENEPVQILTLKEGGFNNELYYACATEATVTVANDTDIEMSKGFAPALIRNNAIYFLGESKFVTVAPHSEATVVWSTDLHLMAPIAGIAADTDFTMAFFDEDTYNFFFSDETVTMHPNPGVPKVSLPQTPRITGAKTATEEVVPGLKRTVHIINDPTEIPLSARLRLDEGYFAYNVYACVVSPEFEEGGEAAEILAQSGQSAFLTLNRPTSFETMISFPLAEAGKYYAVALAYGYGQNFVPIGTQYAYFRLDSSDVDEIESVNMECQDDTIYNLQGIPVGKDLEPLPRGIYIRAGKKLLKK